MKTNPVTTFRYCAIALLACLLFTSCATIREPQGPAIASKDVLYLEKGQELLGTLTSADQNELSFDGVEDGRTAFPIAEVQRVELAPPVGDAVFLSDLQDPELNEWVRSAPAPADLPGRHIVMLYSGTWMTLRDDGRMETRNREVFKILNEKGRERGTYTHRYFPDRGDFTILKARSIGPDGRVSKLAHTAVKEAWPNSRFSAYNRQKAVVFAIPNAEIGSVIEVETLSTEARDDIEKPWIYHIHWASTDPTLRREVVLDRPEGSDYVVADLHMGKGREWVKTLQAGKRIYRKFPSGEVKTETVAGGGRMRTTWVAGPLPVFEKEPYSPNRGDLISRMCILKKTTWPRIAEHFHQAFESRIALDAEARAYVHRLADGKSPREAAHAIYNDLVQRIRRVGIGPGDYSYIPHPASEIFKNGYANDWDKTFLYYAMLREIGLTPALLAVRPWNWDIWSDEPPSISQFGDLVLQLEWEGGTMYAACREDTIPFGQLPGHLYHGRTLLMSDGSGRIGRLPDLTPAEKEYIREIRMEVDGAGNARVSEKIRWNGVQAYGTRWLRAKSPEYLRMRYEKMVRERFPNAKLVSYALSDRNDLDQPAWLELVYDVAPLDVVSSGRYIVLQLPGTSYSPARAQDGPRRFDVRYGEPWRNRSRFEIKLADEVSAAGWPDAVQRETPWGVFQRRVTTPDEKTLLVEDVTEIRAYHLPKAEYEAFSDFFFRRQLAGRQQVVLDVAP